MTRIIVFIAVTIIAIFTAISIYKIINARVTYKKYYPYRKLVMVTLISLPWIFLVFAFTLDWSTYITLVIVRIPYTIIWSLLTAVGIYIDIKMQNKYQHHNVIYEHYHFNSHHLNYSGNHTSLLTIL